MGSDAELASEAIFTGEMSGNFLGLSGKNFRGRG